MITLITGLPGNGKTLYALDWLRKRAQAEGRTVYYNGINDCRIPGWIEGDPEKWMQLPKGSIILIDEVQRIMRPRQHGSKVPDFVAALETHRHLGVDLVLITQHPMLVDSNVRRLVGQHFHVVRKFGKPLATVHEWGKVKETCDKNRDDSIEHHWGYPKDVFSLYKSAEIHTSHGKVPMRVWLLLALPFVLAGVSWYLYVRLTAHTKPPGPPVNQATGQVLTASPSGGAARLTKAEYIASYQPRVEGLQHTAPAYDELTKPVVVPYPAGCISRPTGCSCYTQQGTVYPVARQLCDSIVRTGFFIAWEQKQSIKVADKPVLRSEHQDGAPQASYGGVTSFPHTPRITPMPAESVVNPPEHQPGRGKNLPPVASN